MFIYDMVLWCAGTLKPGLILDQVQVFFITLSLATYQLMYKHYNIQYVQCNYGPVTADLTTTVVHSYKSLINHVKPVNSFTRN